MTIDTRSQDTESQNGSATCVTWIAEVNCYFFFFFKHVKMIKH